MSGLVFLPVDGDMLTVLGWWLLLGVLAGEE